MALQIIGAAVVLVTMLGVLGLLALVARTGGD
jgi:hypothetical protein